jgi:hypothetical protein
MLTKEGISSLQERLTVVREAAARYFAHADPVKADDMQTAQEHWAVASEDIENEGEDLRATIKRLSVDVAGAARGSPLVAEADLQDLRQNTRQMLASVRYKRYRHQGVYVHHDEGVVLGVDPPSQDEQMVETPELAVNLFSAAAVAVRDLIDLLSPTEAMQAAPGTASYRPNTAFIIMAIDKGRPELEDVKNAIKDGFKEFGIQAVTADDIEHDDAITDRILDEIDTSEFLIADLTGERPNVYYEVGHAHARNKRVMLYRKEGTKLHFDLAHRNCPAYANVTTLKDLLRRRLEVVTNRPKKL